MTGLQFFIKRVVAVATSKRKQVRRCARSCTNRLAAQDPHGNLEVYPDALRELPSNDSVTLQLVSLQGETSARRPVYLGVGSAEINEPELL